jgi:16S rRNA (uracil1498-N3)-methyltransferase
MKEKHTFALWYSTLSSLLAQLPGRSTRVLGDETVVHRITHVLRLSAGDQIILFDDEVHAQCVVEKIDKKSIVARIVTVNNNVRTGIPVTVLLPVLKKDDHDAALYSLAALGVETIQLLRTEKTQRAAHGAHELERAHKIVRGAAEQSKYFCSPIIKAPITLNDYLAHHHTPGSFAMVADPEGQSMRVTIIDHKLASRATILVGPEGGLTSAERELVAQHGFIACRLTETILKAEHAVSLLAGIVRSVFQ